MRRLAVKLGILAVAVWVVLALVILNFIPNLNQRWVEFDITCGRTRSETMRMGIRFKGGVEDSEITGMYRELVGEPPEPIWRLGIHEQRTWAGTMRSHPSHHGSLPSATCLARELKKSLFGDAARKRAIETFFKILQEDDHYHRAMDYYCAVMNLASDWRPEGPPIGPDDLPDARNPLMSIRK
jgi:hypothetical protein